MQCSNGFPLGTVVTHAPAMTDFDRDPLELIRTGDWVRVDATAGIVTVTQGRSQ